MTLFMVSSAEIYVFMLDPSGQVAEPKLTTASFYGLGEQCVRHHFL